MIQIAVKQDQEAQCHSNWKERLQKGRQSVIMKCRRKNAAQLAWALFEMRYGRKMRGRKSAESITEIYKLDQKNE